MILYQDQVQGSSAVLLLTGNAQFVFGLDLGSLKVGKKKTGFMAFMKRSRR